MQYYAIVNDKTGEIEGDCSKCGLLKAGNGIDVDTYPKIDNHLIVEIEEGEYLEMQDTDLKQVRGKETKPIYTKKIDISNKAKRIKGRKGIHKVVGILKNKTN